MRRAALALVLALLSVFVHAATFIVEDEALKPAPSAVSDAVFARGRAGLQNNRGEPCTFIGKSVNLSLAISTDDWVVTTADACSWAASAAPVWVVRHADSGYRVVLFDVTYDLTIGSVGLNGLRNIATARATAAREESQLWKFDGDNYQLVRHTVR